MNRFAKRSLALVLALFTALSLLPASAFAQTENRFCLVAEAAGRLVIPPEYITYEAGMTVRQALEASGHIFVGIDSGLITAIDNETGNFNRYDEDGEYDLNKLASEVSFYRFSENTSSGPSAAMQSLMTAMADWLLENKDVKMASQSSYDAACKGFPGASDEQAQSLADDLTTAVSEYKQAQNNLHAVTFAVEGEGLTIRAENEYGKVYTNEDSGMVMQLPAGDYSFLLSHPEGYHLSGELTVNGPQTVSAQLPVGEEWLNTDSVRLAGDYDEEFEATTFAMDTWEERTLTVQVQDLFEGPVYLYAEHTLDTTPMLNACYMDVDGQWRQTDMRFQSVKTSMDKVLEQGARRNTVTLQVGVTDSVTGFTRWVDYTVVLDRIPSLSGITVTDQNGSPQTADRTFESYQTKYIYKVVDTVTQVTVTPVPFDRSYTVTINGEDASNGVDVPLTSEGDTVVDVTVSGGDAESRYTLTFLPGEGRKISFVTNTDVEMEVVNRNDEVLPYSKFREGETEYRYQYTLVPGETYSYVAKQGYYGVRGAFTMEESANSVIQVELRTDDWLNEIALGVSEAAFNKGSLPLAQDFTPENHGYTAYIPDDNASIYLWVDDGENGSTITANFSQLHTASHYDGVESSVDMTSQQAKGKQLKRILLPKSGYGNTLTIHLSRKGDDQEKNITYFQEYVVDLERTLSLGGLSASCSGQTVPLNRADGAVGYHRKYTEYTLRVPAAAVELSLHAKPYADSTENVRFGDDTAGYQIEINGEPADGTVTLPLTGDVTGEQIVVRLTNRFAPESETIYTLTVEKTEPVDVTFVLEPADALLCIHEPASGNRIWPDKAGVYALSEGYTYEYTLTRLGHVGQGGTILIVNTDEGGQELHMNGEVHPVTLGSEEQNDWVEVTATLPEAAQNPEINPDISSEWSDFRGGTTNNAITDAAIPTVDEDGMLYWANKIGEGMDQNATGCPILVDGYLITYAGDKLYRVDTVSGEIVAEGTMHHTSSFSITPPVYADGMIFMALADGVIQAFNADTLESLWIYEDALKGQPNTPMTVKNGYLYTGFWINEVQDANFICLSVTDEDPERTNERKNATWYHTQAGGFYWAGAYVADDYLLVGTDDGTYYHDSDTSQLLLMDSLTGRVLDSIGNLGGDIRSTVAYDSATDACYFTSKGGYFYSVKVKNESGSYKLSDLWRVRLSNGSSEGTPMSTSTPVVYNGRAYVGVSGVGQFSDYSGHNITVINLAAKSIAYQAETRGYPQTSGLLTTAYETQNGYVYVYFFDNTAPGMLRVLRDKAGQTKADYLTTESYTVRGETRVVDTLYALFTPVGEQKEYIICSPITDEYGTIYFKNDTAYMMAFGPAITHLQVVKAPDKTVYTADEDFDPTGMQVIATYQNGKSRDVTAHLTWPALQEGDTTITLTFPYVMYHDQGEKIGVPAGKPTVTVPVTVGAAIPAATQVAQPVIAGDQVTVTFNGRPDTGWMLMAAAYDKDGKLLQTTLQSATADLTQTLTLPRAGQAHKVTVFVTETISRAPVLEQQSVSKE